MTPNGQTGHPYPLFDLLGQPHENHRTTIDWYSAERLHRIRHEPFQPGCLIVAEDGAEGAPGFRVAEGGSDRTTISNNIRYWDDTGFTADGEFRDGALCQDGMVHYRR